MQRHFYYDYKDAIIVRDKIIKQLIGKNWEPYNEEIVDVFPLPNDSLTFHIGVKYSNGKLLTLVEFMEANKIGWSFFK